MILFDILFPFFIAPYFRYAFSLKLNPMKLLSRLYRNNPLVMVLFDAIALLLSTLTVIFIIALFTLACTF
jgi:hypothetical protein